MVAASEDTMDVLVIGGGPAGLAAAVSIARNVHSTVVFDSHEYRNERVDHIHMMPTWDGRDPKTFRAAARQNVLDNYDTITFVNVKISAVGKTEDGLFVATDANRKVWTSHGLILATGIVDLMPGIRGFDDCWGRSIFHCLFCFGFEQRGSPSSGVLAIGEGRLIPFVLHIARNAAQLTQAVTIYTHGDLVYASEVQASIGAKAPIAVDTRRIAAFTLGANNIGVTISFEDGSTKNEAFIAYNPKTELRSSKFAKDLGLEMTPHGAIKVNLFGETSLPGCFAGGDNCSITKSAANAVSTGATAAAGVAGFVQSQKYGQKSLGDFFRETGPEA